jgi:hypothetical protein
MMRMAKRHGQQRLRWLKLFRWVQARELIWSFEATGFFLLNLAFRVMVYGTKMNRKEVGKSRGDVSTLHICLSEGVQHTSKGSLANNQDNTSIPKLVHLQYLSLYSITFPEVVFTFSSSSRKSNPQVTDNKRLHLYHVQLSTLPLERYTSSLYTPLYTA